MESTCHLKWEQARGDRIASHRRPPAREGADILEERLVKGALSLDTQRLGALWQGTPIPLTVTEFWMVHALARRPGHVRSRNQLMEEAQIYVDEASISSHIKRIRRKFQEIDPSFDNIESVYGAGYRWLT